MLQRSNKYEEKPIGLCTELPDGQEDQCNTRKRKSYKQAEDNGLLKYISKKQRYQTFNETRRKEHGAIGKASK
jgi:hypothetical protein